MHKNNPCFSQVIILGASFYKQTAYSIYPLTNKFKLMRKLLSIIVLTCVCIISLHAQNIDYFDYENVTNVVLESLKKAQNKKPFHSLNQLKENCITAKNEESIHYNNLPKANKKEIKTVNLVKQIKPTSLMLCKLKRGFGVYEDYVLIGASAVAISEDGLCVSNYHVFEPLINEGQGMHPQDSLFFAADVYGNVYEITGVKTYSSSADLAIFKIDTRGKKIQAAPLGNDLEVGSTVHTMTAPNQQPYYYTQGIVARNSSFDNNPWENRTEITADFAIGSSGGPVFDDYGNLTSLVSSTTSVYAGNGESRDWQMVMKLTIPVSSIKRLVLN